MNIKTFCMAVLLSLTAIAVEAQDSIIRRTITGTLSITSRPSGAVVKMGGKYMGATPLTLEKQEPGDYSVTFSAKGYETTTLSVSVTAGKTATCSATLKKKQVQQNPVPQPTPSPSPASSSAQTIIANGVSFNMILVEGGTFTMGATPEQGSDAYDSEKPAHQVTLSTYYIGETEVTQELWQAVMETTISQQRDLVKKDYLIRPLGGVGPSYPMRYISWDECQSFISKLNSLTGKNFRLPTEAEWEYVARGGNKIKGYKYSGSDNIGSVAWYKRNSGDEVHPVKTKSPNELGIYDMTGNVSEWCQDCPVRYSSNAQTNPKGPGYSCHEIRGGNYSDYDSFCRLSYRDHCTPDYRVFDTGFRLAL